MILNNFMIQYYKLYKLYAKLLYFYGNKKSYIYYEIIQFFLLKKKYFFSKIIINFINFLFFNKRQFFKKIIIEFDKKYKKYKNIVYIKIFSIFPIEKKFKKKIFKKIKHILIKKRMYIIYNIINPKIIGGFLIKIGYKILDLTIKRKLYKIKKKLIYV